MIESCYICEVFSHEKYDPDTIGALPLNSVGYGWHSRTWADAENHDM